MGTPLPIACTLGASELRARLVEIGALGREALVSAGTTRAGAVLRFRPAPGIRARVDAIVAAESGCCPFLDFTVDHGERETVVRISAPEDGAPAVDELVAAFSGR
jgi:hypothetical protein